MVELDLQTAGCQRAPLGEVGRQRDVLRCAQPPPSRAIGRLVRQRAKALLNFIRETKTSLAKAQDIHNDISMDHSRPLALASNAPERW
jgi:hypothetical protein